VSAFSRSAGRSQGASGGSSGFRFALQPPCQAEAVLDGHAAVGERKQQLVEELGAASVVEEVNDLTEGRDAPQPPPVAREVCEAVACQPLELASSVAAAVELVDPGERARQAEIWE
jgi:hypothetical protein